MRSSNVGDVADAFLGGANFGGGGGISPAAVSPSRVTVRTSPSENSSSTGWRPAPRSPRNEGSNGDVRVSHLSHGSRLGRRRDLRSRLTRCWCWATASSRHTSTNSPLRGTPGGSRGPAADRSDPTTSQRGRLIMPLAGHGIARLRDVTTRSISPENFDGGKGGGGRATEGTGAVRRSRSRAGLEGLAIGDHRRRQPPCPWP